nr:hypothetical protein [Tanacetum cinerariifolium]
IIDGQEDLHAEEGEIQEGKDVTNENVMHSKKFSWGEEIRNAENLVASPIKQHMEDNNHVVTESPEGYRGESETLSKPPGFENFKQQKKHNSHHSSSSCPGAKSSRVSKPISKTFSNHGSMIEA